MSQTVLKKEEEQAMATVKAEMSVAVSAAVFRELWRTARADGGRLVGHTLEQFTTSAAVREEAAITLDDAAPFFISGANHAARNMAVPGATVPDGGGLPGTRRRRPRHREDDEGADIKLSASTMLRNEAMALLIAELAAERADVRDYRARYLQGGILTGRAADKYLDTLAFLDMLAGDEQEDDDELETVTDAVCDAYGVAICDALDIVLCGRLRSQLSPIRVGPPEPGPNLRRLQISFAPWCAPEDAGAALRRAQLHATAGVGTADYVYAPWGIPRDVSGSRVSGPGDDRVRLFIFVTRRRLGTGKQTWGEMMADFNVEQEDEGTRYEKESSFSQAYRRTRSALMAWLPTPRPNGK